MDALAWTTFGLSVIGALAWIPAIRDWLQRPDVQIISGDQLEVSYFEFGGVLNVPCTFASLDQAALVESFSLSVVHEDGARLDFDFVGLSDTATAQSSSGERVHWDRQSRANALVLAKDSSADRLLMFRERSQSRKVKELRETIVPVWERLRTNDPDKWRDEMRKTKEYDEYLRAVREGQPWRQGRYAAVMTAVVRQLKQPVEHRFTFDLSDADIRGIRGNLPLLNDYVSLVLLHLDPSAQRPAMAFAFPSRVTKPKQLPVSYG